MRAIDIHTHVVPAEFPAYAGRHTNVKWPSMISAATCRHRHVMIQDSIYRTVSDECWNVRRRQETMEATGISHQVLSPMPELLSYWLDPQDALALGRHVNDIMAVMVDAAPDRFSALGMVPLQEPRLAVLELERLMRGGCFRGVEIGTNIDGVVVGDERFDEFFAAAAELSASIFIHPLHPLGSDYMRGPKALPQIVANPCETGLAIASLITGGILQRHPQLRIAVSHGGGTLSMILPRLMEAWRVLPAFQSSITVSPLEQAKRLFYDTLVYDSDTLSNLIRQFGVDRFCLGTDHPFGMQDQMPVSRVRALGLTNEETIQLLSGNAARFLAMV